MTGWSHLVRHVWNKKWVPKKKKKGLNCTSRCIRWVKFKLKLNLCLQQHYSLCIYIVRTGSTISGCHLPCLRKCCSSADLNEKSSAVMLTGYFSQDVSYKPHMEKLTRYTWLSSEQETLKCLAFQPCIVLTIRRLFMAAIKCNRVI